MTKRERLRAEGKCVNYDRCGNQLGTDGTSTECRSCARTRNQAQKVRIAALRRRLSHKGLCIEGCGDKAEPGRKRCKHHLAAFAEDQRRRRLRQAQRRPRA